MRFLLLVILFLAGCSNNDQETSVSTNPYEFWEISEKDSEIKFIYPPEYMNEKESNFRICEIVGVNSEFTPEVTFVFDDEKRCEKVSEEEIVALKKYLQVDDLEKLVGKKFKFSTYRLYREKDILCSLVQEISSNIFRINIVFLYERMAEGWGSVGYSSYYVENCDYIGREIYRYTRDISKKISLMIWEKRKWFFDKLRLRVAYCTQGTIRLEVLSETDSRVYFRIKSVPANIISGDTKSKLILRLQRKVPVEIDLVFDKNDDLSPFKELKDLEDK